MIKRFAALCLMLVIGGAQTVSATDFTEYSIAIGSYELYGRLTMPYGVHNPPVAILIHGSGQGNFDSGFGGMALFRDIAHGLAEHGIASIRFNKRYRQHPPLSSNATIQTETMDDVVYAIDFAAGHQRLRSVFLVGFSQGGIVAPHIAYGRDDISGIISLAGSPRGFFDIVVSQDAHLRHRAANLGAPIPRFVQVDWLLRQVMNVDEQALPLAFDTFNNIAVTLGFPIPFMRSINALDTPAIIDDVEIPFLILQGEEDLQIIAAYDFVAWQNLLHNRDNATFILYPGLNHFFAPHMPQLGFDQARARANVDGQVITDMANWINKVAAAEFAIKDANRIQSNPIMRPEHLDN